MADIKTLVEEAKAAARKHAPNARAIIVAIDALAEAHQAGVAQSAVTFRDAVQPLREEVARLTRERDAAFAMSRCECSPDEACANMVRLTRENEGLAADLVSIRSAWNTAEAELAAKQDAAPTSERPQVSIPLSENFYIARDQIKREFRRALGLRPDIGHSGQGTVGFCEQCDLVESMLNQFASSASTVPEWPDEQDPELLQAMKESNKWHFVDDVVPVLKAVKAGEWQWYENTRCKYIELRIDMRDLGCIIRDREKERISPATLAYQYSKSRNPGACSVTDGEA